MHFGKTTQCLGMLVLWHCMHMCMHICWCLLLLIHNTWLSQHLIYDTSTIIHEDNEEKPGGPEPQCLPGLKRHWDLAAHSASITHTETEGKITKVYSNSKYSLLKEEGSHWAEPPWETCRNHQFHGKVIAPHCAT